MLSYINSTIFVKLLKFYFIFSGKNALQTDFSLISDLRSLVVMRLYRADYQYDRIHLIEVEKETKGHVHYRNGRYERKHTKNHGYYIFWDDAHQFLLNRA